MKRSTAFLGLLLAALALVYPSQGPAQVYEYTVYIDTDNDAATGCTVSTAAGDVAGVETSLTAEVAIASPAVTGQRVELCTGGAMTASATFDEGYPVGFGLGPDALDVIELGAPLNAFGQSENATWRLVFGAHSPLLDASDLTGGVSVAGLGLPLTPVLVPATSLALLGALALALLAVAGVVVKRNPQLLSIVAVVSALAISGIAWAAAHVLDGQIGDWPATPLLTDPAGDPTQPEPQADIRQVFAERSGDRVYFRIDVTQTRLDVLIPPLLDTAFSIPENSPDGTVAGTLLPDITGLASLVGLTLDAQTPAAGFGFDAANAEIEVADSALLDFETRPQFDLAFTLQVAGAAGFSLPVAVTVAIEDVNEAPQIAPQSFSVSEHEDAGEAIGTVAASDVDAGANGELSFAITGGSGQALFAIDPASGEVEVAGTLDLGASPYTLDVTVSDGGAPPLSATAAITVEVYNKNDPPTAVALDPSTVTENQPAATLIGALTTTDVDAGDTHSYSLACATPGADDASVAVDGDLLRTAASLNFEAAPTLAVCVRSTDAGGLHVDQNLTITVVDADDLPVAVNDVATVNEDAAATAIDVLANDSDEDGDAFTIASATQPANGSVVVTGGGTGLTYAPNADYCNSLAGTTDDFTYTLAPGGATATVQVTVACVNDAPLLTLPGTQNAPPNTTLVFGIDEGNAITVADVDADAALLLFTIEAEAGTLTLADTAALASVSGNGTGAISATGTLAALNAALDGLVFAAPATAPGDGAVAINASIDDQGASGSGGAQSDSGSFEVTVDAAPQVTATTPAAGSVVANDVALSVGFSEAVNVAAGGVTLTCGGANLITGGDSGAGVTSLAPTYTAPLPAGACILTVLAANVSDVDTIDPPDTLAADVVVNFTVDAAPTVTATSPVEGAIVASDAALSVSFSEAVDASAGAVTLTCGGPNLITGGDTGSGVATLAPAYAAPLPAGACTLTVVAANIDDSDVVDPPANPPADHVVNFTVDAAPAFVSATPAEAAVVGVDATVSFTFDEPVDDLGGAIALDCGGAIAGSISGGGSATLTFTPAAPLPEGATCSATAVASGIGDSDAADPPDHPIADVVRNFSVDAAPSVVSIAPADGAIDVGLDTDIVVTFSEPVNFSAAAFTLACGASVPFTVSGDGTDTATIDPTPATLPINTACVFTVDAAQVSDVDAADPPDAGSGVTTVNFTTVDDSPPSVVSTTPAAGATVANDVALSVTFSEAVDVAAGGITLTCGGGDLITGGASGSNVTSLAPSYAAPLPAGACTLTVLAASVTDVDAIDPPDDMLADHVVGFTVDAAPEVTGTVPANGAADVTTSATLTIDFSEAVDLAAGAVTLDCGAGAIGFGAGLPASNVTSVTLTPAAALPGGANCTATVVAANVTDTDANDPPDAMAANHVFGFATDAAPEVTSTTPAAAEVVASTATITVNFSEAVDLDAGVFALDCGGAIAVNAAPALPASGVASITFTPTAALAAGANCTATVAAGAVHDADSNDPPDTMAANHVWNFSVDVAPFVVATTPANGASGVDPTGNITIDFSESVNFDTTANAANTSFDLECPGGSPADFSVLTASPASSVSLNPVDNAVAGTDCILTVRAAGIADADAIDPPDTMAADFSAGFSFAAIANDDAYTVTPHLTLSIGAASPQGGGVLGNDVIGAGSITGFGFAPACSGTAAGNQLNAGAANGRLLLDTDGSFSYEPPAAVTGDSRTFCYTVTGGDTANVVFTLQNTELVWFVDASAPGGGDGTQARPFLNLAGAAAVDTANDTLFLAFDADPYTGGITLEAGERLVGSASGGTLAAISGVTPVAGSDFPALGGNAPTIVCAGTCITLGSGNTLRGFTVGNSGLGGTDLLGSGFGTLTVGELTLGGDGRALALSNGVLNGNFLDIDVSAGNLDGISLDGVGGTWTVTGPVGIGSVSGTGLSLVNAPAGASATFTGGVSVAKTGAGTAVNLAGNHATAVVNLGNVALTAGSVGNAGTGLAVSNSPATISGGTISTVAGPAINASGATFTGGAVLSSVSSSGSGTQGVNLSGVTGAVSIAGGAIANATGTAFNVDAGASAVTYGGTINNAAGRSVVVQNRTGSATVAFTGVINDTGTGVLINANAANSVTSFRGGLVLNTGANAAFTATSGGTLEVCDENPCNPATGALVNMLTTTTGTALNVGNTTIGANGLTFRSINVTGNDVLPVNGIVLNNTGALGGLTVTGTDGAGIGAPGLGGTIRDTSGDAISLTSTQGFTINWMNITSNLGDGIGGSAVHGFDLNQVSIIGNGDSAATDESGINIVNLTGTAAAGARPTRIVNSTISNNFEFEIQISNTSGTLTDLQMSGNTISSNGFQPNHGNLVNFLVAGGSTANMTLNVTSGAFTGNTDTSGGRIITATGVQCDHSGSGGTMTCNVSGATFTNNNVGPQASVAGGGQMVFDFNNNTIVGSRALAVNFFADANPPFTKTLQGRTRNSTIGTFGVTGSGSTVGYPIGVQNEGRIPVTMAITGNTVQESLNFTGINVNHGISVAAGTAASHVTITGNTIREIDNGRAVLVQALDYLPAGGNAGTVCADIAGNTMSNIVGQAGDGTRIRIRRSDSSSPSVFNVRQAAATAAANANELDDANGFNNPAQISVGGTPTYNAGACTQPSN